MSSTGWCAMESTRRLHEELPVLKEHIDINGGQRQHPGKGLLHARPLVVSPAASRRAGGFCHVKT